MIRIALEFDIEEEKDDEERKVEVVEQITEQVVINGEEIKTVIYVIVRSVYQYF